MTHPPGDNFAGPLPHSYGTFCDDFYVNVRLGSHLPMPSERGTVLHFLEQMQRGFPGLLNFRSADAGECHLEEDRRGNAYRWVSLERRRLAAGHVNPPTLEEAARLHRLALKIAPYQLGISAVEVEYLDVLLGFDLEFNGDHEDVLAETLFAGSPLACLLEEPDARPAEFAPAAVVSLSEDRSLQARLEVLTRANSVRLGGDADGAAEDVISVYFTLRRHWRPRPAGDFEAVFDDLLTRADALAARYVVPGVLRPISQAIASRS